MSFRVIRALAKGVVLESIRRKDLWVVAILGFLILGAAGILGVFGVDGLEIFAKDLAGNVLGLFSLILAVMTACRLVPDEVRNKTLYPLLARPISRWELLMGKFVGAVVVSWIGFLALAALTAVALAMFHVQFEPIMLQYLFGKMLGLTVVCAVGMSLSVAMTPNAAATLAFLLCSGSSTISRAMGMAGEGQPSLVPLFQAVNAAMPQVHLFDLSGRAVYLQWAPVPLWVMGSLTAYAAVYCAAMMALGWVRFRRQAL